MVANGAKSRARFVAEVEGDSLRALVERDHIAKLGESPAHGEPSKPWSEGTIVLAHQREPSSDAVVERVLAEPETALAELYRIAAACGVDSAFPDDVLCETDAWLANPRIDDPELADLTHLPFVTIDSQGVRDLDQALFVEGRRESGWIVHYAIADAAFFVPRGSALFRESLRRGASFYLPGLAVPMLPRPLSENLVSLNPDGPRRALVFRMTLDSRGNCVHTDLVRGRIRSRAKLSFDDVQELHDDPERSWLKGSEMERSLLHTGEVGKARLAEAKERDVVRYKRNEIEVALGARGEHFVVLDGLRSEVELWNEQISLLCNAEGARVLKTGRAETVQPIYRIHPPPNPERIENLRATIAKLVEVHGLDPERWLWDEGQTSLAVYIRGLPEQGPDVGVARAISRQAILVNVRSTYSSHPSAHYGAGFDPYARFSAPMREVVGVYLHGEAAQWLAERAGRPIPESCERAETLREQVIDAANRSRELQRRITDLVNRRVIDRLFTLNASPDATWWATVMGVSGSKIHLTLDRPAIDVKMYLRDASRVWGISMMPDELGVLLRERESGDVCLVAGDRVEVKVAQHDQVRDRWVLEPVSSPPRRCC